MTNRTQLASGEILSDTTLSIWLVQPADKRYLDQLIMITWP